MGERFRVGFIALTVVVVAVAVISAIFSAARPKPPQSPLYTPPATLSPSPSPSPRPTFTPQPPTPTAVAPTSTPVATVTPSPSPTFIPYVIQPGETLRTIARSHGVTLQAILAANPDITDSHLVKAGQTILIPPPGWAPSSSPSSSPRSS